MRVQVKRVKARARVCGRERKIKRKRELKETESS